MLLEVNKFSPETCNNFFSWFIWWKMSKLTSAAIFHLESNWQILSYCFLESIPAIHLWNQTLPNESVAEFPYVERDLLALLPKMSHSIQMNWFLFKKVKQYGYIKKYFQFTFKIFWNRHLSEESNVLRQYQHFLVLKQIKLYGAKNW